MKFEARSLSFLAAALIAVGSAGCGGGSSKGGSASATAPATSGTPQALPEARGAPVAVLLRSGDIFVAGGVDLAGNPLASTVVITADEVKPGPTLLTPRAGHSATLLENGQVLIAGGRSDDQGLQVEDSTELYDPLTNAVAPGPSLTVPRADHAALAYKDANGDEQVIIVGGVAAAQPQTPPAFLDSAELIQPATGVVKTLTARLSEPQARGAIVRLDSGKLLIASGTGANGPALPQVFDPKTETVRSAQSVIPRTGAAVISKGAEVLVAGGESQAGVEDSTEVFDSASGTFAVGARLGEARHDASATLVAGQVVLIGGRGSFGATSAVEVVEGSLSQATVRASAPLQHPRYDHAALAVGKRVLVIGGFDFQGQALTSIESIDPNAATPAPPATPAPTAPGPAGPLPAPAPAGLANPALTASSTTPASTRAPPTAMHSTARAKAGPFGGFLSSIFSGFKSLLNQFVQSAGGWSGILNGVIQSAIQAITQGGGFSGFLQSLLNNLLGGGSGGGGTTGGLGGILSGLLGGLTGGGSGGGSSGGLGGILSGLLGGLTGGSGGTTGGGGLGGILSGLLGGLLGGGSGGATPPTGGTTPPAGGGLGGILSGLLGGLLGGGGSGGATPPPAGGGTAPPAGPTAPPAGPTTPPPATGNLTITGMTPRQGPVGTSVTITGNGFGSTVGVAFNGTPGAIQSATRDPNGNVNITVTVPAGATTGPVQVSSGGNTATAGVFTVQ